MGDGHAGKPCCVICGKAVESKEKMPGAGATAFRNIMINGESIMVFPCDTHMLEFWKMPDYELAQTAQMPKKLGEVTSLNIEKKPIPDILVRSKTENQNNLVPFPRRPVRPLP